MVMQLGMLTGHCLNWRVSEVVRSSFVLHLLSPLQKRAYISLFCLLCKEPRFHLYSLGKCETRCTSGAYYLPGLLLTCWQHQKDIGFLSDRLCRQMPSMCLYLQYLALFIYSSTFTWGLARKSVREQIYNTSPLTSSSVNLLLSE